MNSIDFGAAFFEGLLLALSPCILSILPIVLSTSLNGGKGRPIGVIVGLICSFVLFSLFLGKTISLIGLRPEVIRLIANCSILVFALLMLVSSFSDRFNQLTAPVSSFGNQMVQKLEKIQIPNGLLSGLLIGACLGLIWTPCIGPILGIAVAQAASKVSVLHNFMVISCFCVGVALPMLSLVFFGKGFLDKLSFLKTNSPLMRQAFASVMFCSVIFTSSPSIHFAQNWFKASLLGDKQAQMYLNVTKPHGLQIGCTLNI